MHISDFDYELPSELIAQYPAPERHASRLLCLSRSHDGLTDAVMLDLPDLLQPGDLLVMNDTKVIPARLLGQKASGGRAELVVERVLNTHEWLCQIGASKAPKPGGQILVAAIPLDVLDRRGDLFHLKSPIPVMELLEKHGHMPLPPYIQRDDNSADKDRYQTVYARVPGAVAAPTAGLHFDQQLFDALASKGIQWTRITLHVGMGTFQPVRVENVLEHRMHNEYMVVTEDSLKRIRHCKDSGGRLVAVGTTSVRCLESLPNLDQAFSGDTDIFIYPGYRFRYVDAMITNFHLPRSTLLMLVSAFAGREKVLRAYRHAVEQRYRFYSYGDAMLIE